MSFLARLPDGEEVPIRADEALAELRRGLGPDHAAIRSASKVMEEFRGVIEDWMKFVDNLRMEDKDHALALADELADGVLDWQRGILSGEELVIKAHEVAALKEEEA